MDYVSSIIDSHQHFWRYNPDEFGWIDDDMRVIRRDFLPADLQQTLASSGVDGSIAVQARQTLEETRWLLDLADEYPFIRGVVGWVPLVDPRVRETLQSLAARPKLRAVRHVLQGEADDRYMLRDDFNGGIDALRESGLRYDLLIRRHQLPWTTELVDRHPGQIFILDHLAKPNIAAGELSPWRENLRELARRPNVYCKLSGMVTEADYQRWTPEQLRPYADVVLNLFGAKRVMFGSDWPVCLVAATYPQWRQSVQEFTRNLSQSERDHVFGKTAIEAYGLT
jgi:L-fucono-1,5-lactonase